jgi:5-formyltetrahydrofolate cyclo-ligase
MPRSSEPDDPTDESFSKAQWRTWARTVRATLPDASSLICAHLETFIRHAQPRVVLSYRAFRDEPQLESLVEHVPSIRFLTPRVASTGILTLHDFSSATVMNRFGILEPPPRTPPVLSSLVDLVLVPGLLFTSSGARLGYGGGFYDRLLPTLRDDAPRVGVTRDALVVEELPLEDWDVGMTHLCTETGVRTTS